MLRDDQARAISYEKLLLATGGMPRALDIPGGDLEGIYYYRYLDDYLSLRPRAVEGATATVIGGGFIGSEIAAALHTVGVHVTMVYPDPSLVARVFPERLGRRLQEHFQERGITIHAGDAPTAIEMSGSTYVTRTKNGQVIGSDLVIVGIGIHPATDLAEQAGLTVENGIAVNERLQTSNPDIYAAGDSASFPYQALDMQTRVEHWDNALNMGKQAGRNMAGASESYTYMPYFFSDLFEFGYEAVGEVDARLDTFADWMTDFETGVIYYLRDGYVRGVMLCNVWEKLDAARALIQRGEKVSPEELRGAISKE
ncbi:MAG: Putidaredoxin reductase [bacterium ADurb.Bin429]|nr:MAG: Putidaredoxin reductase [bacterium ADurb.Bin429]